MDKEQARLVLQSFRPDGADVGDPDFAEALRLAMENRELGEWLASERAFDAAFASALGSVDLPQNLREDIMACLAAERGDFSHADDATDALWIGAMASIQPPASLRNAVIAAMDRTAGKDVAPANIWKFKRLAIPLAAAAAIALAFFITRPAPPAIAVNDQSVPLAVVKAEFVKAYESPSFDLEKKQADQQVLVNHLRERKLPCPGDLPPGFRNVKGLGCRELVIDGKRGSLVCFIAGDTGVVHLVIFRREDVSGELSSQGSPAFSHDGKWASACWTDGNKVFLAMSEASVAKLTELF